MQDLYSITPDQFLEFGDGVVHNLSWQQARHINVPIRGVYVANPGYVLGAAAVPRGAVITEVGGKEIATLADFEQVVATAARRRSARRCASSRSTIRTRRRCA